MKAKNTKPVVLADSAGVDTYMQKLDHPLRDVLEALRKTILSIDSGRLNGTRRAFYISAR